VFRKLASNQTALFWILHAGGWLGYAVLNYLIGIEVNEKPANYFLPSVMYAAGGVVITYCLRWLFKAVWDQRPWHILLVSGLGSAFASTLFTGFRSFVHIQFYGAYQWADLSFVDYFNLWDLYISLYVIGTWSGLYFGIKFYQMVQQQNERLLKATSAAHEAQLKMLRYQLNPHFLFNTLNAISTLVLEEQTRTANGMVTRLSSFLRHSLDSDPMQKVSLKKEIDALNLYLSIEKVRFEERLEVAFDIEPLANQALVPSMLLQPLIENAIKYAIAVSEDGGKISIAGKIENGKLCLRIADTGPGAAVASKPLSVGTSGVGLANTRERLGVLYGDEYLLEMENLEPSGLAVTICIPFEHSAQEDH
jgi:signal transduction histidine kinase